MRSFVHAIADPLGLHARSCVSVAREASKWASKVVIRHLDVEADGKSMASLLSLRAHRGDVISVNCNGPDEAEAASALEALMRMSL